MRGLLIISFIFFQIIIYAQSADYSQIVQHKLFYNPAFAGTNICPRIFMAARTKYVSHDNLYKTMFLSYDQNIMWGNFDIGGVILRDDRNGVFVQNRISAIIAKGIEIKKKYYLKAGIQFGMNNDNFNKKKFSYNSMIDPVYGFIYADNESISDYSINNIDLSLGTLFYTSNLYIGFSIFNLTKPSDEFNNIIHNRRYSLHAGYSLYVNKKNGFVYPILLIPTFYYMQESQFKKMNLGLQAKYLQLIGGIFVNNSIDFEYESFVILVGFEQKKFKFAYDCGIVLGDNSGFVVDNHEITLTFYPGCGKNRNRIRAVKCPGL